MKKHVLFISTLSFCFSLLAQVQTTDPVLMIVNGEKITKSDFEYIYNKNNSNNSLDKKDINEYAMLFADLKLKVVEAKSQGLDTTQAFKEEFNGYRSQSAKPYMTDRKYEEYLVQEAYNRLKQEINVSHILIKIDKTDTTEAYQKAIEIRKRLNKENFATVAREVSDDKNSAGNSGELGYITAFQTILSFEDAAYNTPVGKISQPIRSRYGYHIIKVNNKRPSQGSVFVAHIMKIVPNNTTDEVEKSAKLYIDSIYQRLQAGEDFAELARTKSEHLYSAPKGGELGWFSTGGSGAGASFEDIAFSLKVGEYSVPVRSIYGYHIIKLLDKKPLDPIEEKREEILRNFSNDGRNNEILNQFKKELRKEYNLQIIQSSIDEIKKIAKDFTTADSTFFAKTERLNNPLFSFSTIVYTQKQFIDFLKKHKGSNLDIDKSLNLYIDNRLLEHEDTQLESKYPEFRMLVQEYYDGMLMFEVSSKEVWEKAAEDTQGLKAFFEANKQNYTWDTPRFKGTLVFCKDKKAEKKALKIMKTSPADSIPIYLNKALNTDKEKIVKIEKGLFMMGENQAIDKYVFGTGNYIPPTEYPIVISNGKIMEKGPDQYVDMKGIVISDYQNYLQDEWIKMLRKKYPVVIFQDVLQTVEVKE